MTEELKADAPAETLADFWQRMLDEGVDATHVRAMIDRANFERAEAIAKAGRLFYRKSDGEPFSALDCSNEFDEMTRRCWGLFVAISGLAQDNEGDIYIDGISQLANDIAFSMERLSETFSAERKLARLNEKGA